jgi:hypothetical protein
MDDYYVYVYIDPRNNEEFYYGKGKGSRKNAHLESASDTEKTKRIAAIRKAGLEPVIRVVARGLTEHDAFLVENAYLHKLGKSLTNISSGYYADKFRPHDTLHLELSDFDYKSGVTSTSDRVRIGSGRIAASTASYLPDRAHSGHAQFAASMLVISLPLISSAEGSLELAK